MSGRERERERDRRAAAANRTNEYFLPGAGIDREVITADICRYLGNDALVRPGVYEDPQTRQPRQGFYITAYRNFTSAMIADLKADSERWENERRATLSRGQPSNVGYRDSTTHQSRQYYGPTEPQAPGNPGYGTSAAGPQVVYNDGSSYPPQQQQQQQQQSYGQPSGAGYTQPGYAVVQDNYYVAGADLGVAEPRARVPVSQPGINVPRAVSNVQYPGTPSYQQPDNRSYYPAPTGPSVTAAPSYSSQQQPQDPYYGRDNMYSPQDSYDNRPTYQDNGSYSQSQAPMAQSTPAVVPNTGSRREREREPEPRDRHSHRSNRR